MHRLLPPTAIAGVSVVCALGPWVFTAPVVLRSLAAAAAVTAVAGAVVLRRWDTQAGRRVADLTRARASDEWRFEERVAELESDLEESRGLRSRLEQKLRAKRSELARLRNEHAALLRRYATAETERASALEGRRLLELEAATDLPALPAAPSAQAVPATAQGSGSGGRARAQAQEPWEPQESEARRAGVAPAVFSPEGSALFARAGAALARLGADGERGERGARDHRDAGDGADAGGGAGSVDADDDVVGVVGGDDRGEGADRGGRAGRADAAPEADAEAGTARAREAAAEPEGETGTALSAEAEAESADAAGRADGADDSGADDSGADADAAAQGGRPQHPAGHFAVPTAVAVVPPAPARRQVTAGGFDFFGTKKGAPPAALDAVQNEDLADVVGPEALALHKAASEAGRSGAGHEPAGAAAGAEAANQVIDLTAHDETEQLDVLDLRTAAS
ncbi:hypothetical protein ACFUCQ_27145 [Streptomyces sp. NPDC057197]|uniref:hypothetical protein n=1 Tax=Streptomyces sp. NPDC057197 TaxID=3346045 RepID=UPI00362A58ED